MATEVTWDQWKDLFGVLIALVCLDVSKHSWCAHQAPPCGACAWHDTVMAMSS